MISPLFCKVPTLRFFSDVDEFFIFSGNGRQLIVGALLDDLAVIDNKYPVGVAHSFQPVSDHDNRLIVGQFCNGLHQFLFIFGVNSYDSLIRNFSFVFQRVYLFSDTIANNIRFGKPDASMEEVQAAAKKARCYDFIMALPDGFDTVIGEGGATLSGGERQRISIARAIMKDAPVIILDEATANVDPENEKELMEAVAELTHDKTVIMIAHRLKTVRNVDRIFVVDHGEIVQQGTHDELMAVDGLYRRFVVERKQAAGWKV